MPVLHIHRAQRADTLAEALSDLMVAPLEDPLAFEVVAVHTRGMERWLSQRLSARLGAGIRGADGVCANVRFPTPRRLVAEAIAAASGVAPQADPWSPERAPWRLLEVLDAHRDEAWLHSLAARLGNSRDCDDPLGQGGRLSAAAHLSDLFDRYASYRPAMVRAWAGGVDSDGSGAPLGADAAWQAQLWRALRAQIGIPGPAERMERACVRLGQDARVLELPERLALFGLTRLPISHAAVLQAIGRRREVHLFALHPSPALWDALARARPPAALRRRRADRSADLAHNDLLASWGTDARETQLVLRSHPPWRDRHHGEPYPSASFAPSTLLAGIQRDVHANRRAPGAPVTGQPDRRRLLDPDDRTVQVHSCHGRARQVEVLRDAILHELADDPTLEPRDVIVMCPDVEAFAPLIQATFGAGSTAPTHEAPPADRGVAGAGELRVRLADRALRQTNALIAAVLELLDMVNSRMTASRVLDFADREPVRRRFRFDDDDLARVQSWVAQAGIRWGLDDGHRAPFKLARVASGTWRAGLDRVLVGIAMTEEGQRLVSGVLPLDDVGGGEIDLAGRFAELLSRLQQALDALSGLRPLAAWAKAIGDAADAMTAPEARQAWQRAQLRRVLDDLVAEADTGAGATTTPLSVTEVRELLARRAAGSPTRANFRTGHLTVCTLYPMRSVPHRVVCLLGLDDGAFPRREAPDGDDLLADEPLVGERDIRSEDRQLLLDALLAAGERLIVTYTGNDERTNLARPPAVPVGELLDLIDATARGHDRDARAQVLVRHPLAAFDPRNFRPGALVAQRPWSHDKLMLGGALALTGPRRAREPFLTRPLAPVETQVIELEQLLGFVAHPIRAFLRGRLRVAPRELSVEVQDALPVELDGLARFTVGQRLLDACLAGLDPRGAIQAEIARGGLPPGVLGEPVIRELYPTVEAIVAAARSLSRAPASVRPLDIRVALADGRLLIGTVAITDDDLLLAATYARVSPRQRMSAWVRLLAAAASEPQRSLSAVTVGRPFGSAGEAAACAAVAVARIGALTTPNGGDPTAGPPAPEARRQAALAQLATLVDLYDRGMREPLPLYSASSSAYAQATKAGRDPRAAARRAWTSDFRRDREDREPEHRLVLDGVRRFDDLLSGEPRANEQGRGWADEETSRFGRLARRLWDGLLDHEEVVVT